MIAALCPSSRHPTPSGVGGAGVQHRLSQPSHSPLPWGTAKNLGFGVFKSFGVKLGSNGGGKCEDLGLRARQAGDNAWVPGFSPFPSLGELLASSHG